jgi:Uma2 family endonuclease
MATITIAPVSEKSYREIALGDPGLELHRGRLREKPGMSVEHNDVSEIVTTMLRAQLDRNQYRVRENMGRLRRSADTYYVPDIMVIPAALTRALREQPCALDAYAEPVPLVVEIWSPSTGAYDIREKLAAYQERGDRAIWFIHPYERTLTAWRRQPDGSYIESVFHKGVVLPALLPGVVIDLDEILSS